MYAWVMSHVWMCHVACMNESCRMYEWGISHVWMCVMSHVCMGHVTCRNVSCHTYEWVMSNVCINMSHIWMSHVVRTNESCHTNRGFTSHVCINHVIRKNEPCHAYKWDMSHVWMGHVELRCGNSAYLPRVLLQQHIYLDVCAATWHTTMLQQRISATNPAATAHMSRYTRCNIAYLTAHEICSNTWDVATCQSWHMSGCNRIRGRHALLQQHISHTMLQHVNRDIFTVATEFVADTHCCSSTYLSIHEMQSCGVGAVPLYSVRSTGLR